MIPLVRFPSHQGHFHNCLCCAASRTSSGVKFLLHFGGLGAVLKFIVILGAEFGGGQMAIWAPPLQLLALSSSSYSSSPSSWSSSSSLSSGTSTGCSTLFFLADTQIPERIQNMLFCIFQGQNLPNKVVFNHIPMKADYRNMCMCMLILLLCTISPLLRSGSCTINHNTAKRSGMLSIDFCSNQLPTFGQYMPKHFFVLVFFC